MREAVEAFELCDGRCELLSCTVVVWRRFRYTESRDEYGMLSNKEERCQICDPMDGESHHLILRTKKKVVVGTAFKEISWIKWEPLSIFRDSRKTLFHLISCATKR